MGQSFRDESGSPQVSRTCAQRSARTIAEGFSGRKTRTTPHTVGCASASARGGTPRDDSFSSPLPQTGPLGSGCGRTTQRVRSTHPRYRDTGEGSRRTTLEQAGGVGGCKCQCYSKQWCAAEHTPHPPSVPPGWCGWPLAKPDTPTRRRKTAGGLAQVLGVGRGHLCIFESVGDSGENLGANHVVMVGALAFVGEEG